jgi:hypothetical protein
MSVRRWPVAVARLEVSTKAYCNAAGVALVGAYPQTLNEADHDGSYAICRFGRP